VLTSCNGFVHSVGSAPYLLLPQTLYECVGDVPNVAFLCAALTDSATGRIAIYYGCADTVTGLAFTTVNELLDYLKANSEL
jgi:beta-1,4-mannooligosaccharide/beta-1,4-mannosyl-N-acetylglucosamine phosphorylase